MKMYYLEDKERGPLGNKVVWVSKNNPGYTCDINKAEEFTEQEVNTILSISSANYSKHEADYIKKIATPYVNPKNIKNSNYVIINIEAEEKVKYDGQIKIRKDLWLHIKKELDAGASSNDFIETYLNRRNAYFDSSDFEIIDYKEVKGE